MEHKNVRAQEIDEVPYGVYVWKMPNGQYVGDEDGNMMSIQSRRGDIQKMAELRRVAQYYGLEEGEPHYISGGRWVTDEEYDLMRERMEEGLVPDPADPGNWRPGV